MVTWFEENFMQANPTKFQYSLFGASDQFCLQLTSDIVVDAMDKSKIAGCGYR